jgi:hypothetical protein
MLGIALIGLDAATGLSASVARHMGLRSIHIAFPGSLAVYAAGGAAVECLYRLAPIPILMGLIGLAFRAERSRSLAFWSLAGLTSLIEPASLAVVVAAPWAVAVLGLIAFGVNLEEAYLLRRFGWPAPLITRLVFYVLWHVGWPMIGGAG